MITDEMASALAQREQLYDHADALLDEFDDLAKSRKRLRAALDGVELRLQQMGAYFISESQSEEVAGVGGDLPRFCDQLGVDGVARIPAHRFDEALAALRAQRRRSVA
jgi:hypothetical protein